jgi:hypothetical protein
VRTDASVLVLRSIDDEASLALIAGSIVSKLSYLLLSLVYFVAIAVQTVLMAMIVVMVLTFISVLVFHNFWLADYLFPMDVSRRDDALAIGLITLLSFKVLIFFMMIPLGLMALGRSVNGRELLFGGIVREINVQSVPDSDQGVEVRTLLPEPSGWSLLRHSIYENSSCGPEVAKWLRTKGTGSPITP